MTHHIKIGDLKAAMRDAEKRGHVFKNKQAALKEIITQIEEARSKKAFGEKTLFFMDQGVSTIKLALIYINHIDLLLSEEVNEVGFAHKIDEAIAAHYAVRRPEAEDEV